MPRHAFKMQLFEAQIAEYQRRHEEIWPDLSALLRASGISDYTIFWDAETNILFGVMEVTDLKVLEALPQNPIMQRWWTYMSDIMETNPDHSPVTKVLKEVFYLA